MFLIATVLTKKSQYSGVKIDEKTGKIMSTYRIGIFGNVGSADESLCAVFIDEDLPVAFSALSQGVHAVLRADERDLDVRVRVAADLVSSQARTLSEVLDAGSLMSATDRFTVSQYVALARENLLDGLLQPISQDLR